MCNAQINKGMNKQTEMIFDVIKNAFLGLFGTPCPDCVVCVEYLWLHNKLLQNRVVMITAVLEVRWFQLPVFLGVPLAMVPEFLEAPLGYRMSGLSLSPGGSQGLFSLYGLSSRGAELLKGWIRPPEYKSGSCQAFQRLRPGAISVPLLPPSFS